jgi:hypothetical protein
MWARGIPHRGQQRTSVIGIACDRTGGPDATTAAIVPPVVEELAKASQGRLVGERNKLVGDQRSLQEYDRVAGAPVADLQLGVSNRDQSGIHGGSSLHHDERST